MKLTGFDILITDGTEDPVFDGLYIPLAGLKPNLKKELKQQILENQKLRELVNERIIEDIEECLCSSGRSCTYCHDRRNLESLLKQAKE